MSIFLNAFPLKIPDVELEARKVPYDKETLDDFRKKYGSKHSFRREGNDILIFSGDATFSTSGSPYRVALKDNFGIFCSLVKDGMTRYLAGLGRNPTGFNPIELVSTKLGDNLLTPILGETYPFRVCAKYSIDTRIVQGHPCLVIDCTTRNVLEENCLYFLNEGFDLVGRFVVTGLENGYRKFLGTVSGCKGELLNVLRQDGQEIEINAKDVYLQTSRTNFDDYLSHTHGAKKDVIIERIRRAVSIFNGGENKKQRIDTLKNYIQSKTILLIDGTRIEIDDSPNIQRNCVQMQKPVFVFNDNGEADWAEKGLTQSGPYTKRTFDRNDPSICVICAQQDKGRVEQFVRKLLKGISNSKYFNNGLEGKFAIGTSSRPQMIVWRDTKIPSRPPSENNPMMAGVGTWLLCRLDSPSRS